MSFEETIKKLKTVLADDKYNILGYDYNEKQMKKLEPWFYPWKKKNPLPPEIGVYLDELEQKYPLISQKKTKGGIYFFGAIKADGFSLEEIQAKLQDYEKDLLERYERIGEKQAYEFKGNMYIPAHQLVFVFENGVSDELYEAIISCHKGIDVGKQTRPFIIDMQNKRASRHKGLPKAVGSPNPKKIGPKIFN